MVDAGWFLSAAAETLNGRSRRTRRREDILVDAPTLVQRLMDAATEATGAPCDRVLWYDGQRDDKEPTSEHVALAGIPDVALRLGPLRSHDGRWEQKRVDAMIQRDMVELCATHGEIVLIAGDEDLTVAVEWARELGARVRVWGASESLENHAQAQALLAAADSAEALPQIVLDGTVQVREVIPVLRPNQAVASMMSAVASASKVAS